MVSVQQVLMGIIVLVFSLTVHECAHGWAALRYGDPTARNSGRLTLNPLPHLDLWGSLVFPLILMFAGGAMFGWAKPVPVDTRNLRDPWNDYPKVAAAGPLSNLILALGFALLFGVLGRFVNMTDGSITQGGLSLAVVSFLLQLARLGIQLNVILALFNLMPIPPLDGSWILMRFLPPRGRQWLETLSRYGMLPVIGFIILMRATPLGMIWGKLFGTVLGIYWGLIGFIIGG